MGGIRKDSLWAFRGYGSCNVTKRLEDRLIRARTYDQEGNYRGKLSTNPLDPDSVSSRFLDIDFSGLCPNLHEYSKRTEFGVMPLEYPHRNDLHSCRISCCTSGRTLVKARPNSRGRIQRTVAPSMMKGLPSASGKMQNSSSAPTETATGLATRQPPGERSRSSPSPATIRLFDEKWLRNWTETRTC